MTVHIIKLSVGTDSLEDLAQWQQERLQAQKRKRQPPELVHVTRFMPKRAGDVLNGGSIYWVVKGLVVARQKLLELRPLVSDGVPHCGLVYAPELVRVSARPCRPFQGWRYLEPSDAPPDITPGSGEEDLPDDIRRELAELGLL